MLIRPITEADWPAFYPVFREVVAAGETYAYPEGLSSAEAARAVGRVAARGDGRGGR